jgi:CubicO group peptidase (beta-lactamase class C family)
MTSGLRPHDQPGLSSYQKFILGLPLQHTPGSRWAYASAPVDLLSMITSNVTGRKLRDVFNQQIAGPVGASPVGWGEFAGSPITGASSKAQVRPRDLARFGYLLMRDGSWNGRRILSAARANALVDGDHSAHTAFHPTAGSPFLIDSSPQRFYGQLWWTNRTRTALGSKVPTDAFYAHGMFERLLVVVPSRDLVVVRYGSSPKSQPSFKREFMNRVMDALVTSS